VVPMTEKPGHFEQGRWVVDNKPPAPQAGGEVIDKRLSEATRSVISSIDNVMSVARDLVSTDEGKQFIEKKLYETQKELQKSFDEILIHAKDELNKKVKG